MKTVLACLFWIVTLATMAVAQSPLKGSDAPALQNAVSLWLDGQDKDALDSMARLARADNRAAQILLAAIAETGKLHFHVTKDMPRKDRIALLRVPKGLSGKSWLTQAQEDEPLAVALQQSTRTGEKAPAVAALFELGEPTRALLAAQSMLLQGQGPQVVQILLALDDKLPDEASVLLAWALMQSSGIGNGRYVGSARTGSLSVDNPLYEVSQMAWTGIGPRPLMEDKAVRDQALRLHDKVDAWTPVRQFCETHCGETSAACTAVGVSLLSGGGPFPMRSPLESLISNETYWQSPRIEQDLARSALEARRYGAYFDSLDACFVDKMTSLQARFGSRPK